MKKIITSLLMLVTVTAFAQTTVKTSVRDSILTNKDTIKITTAVTTSVTYTTHKYVPPVSTGTGTIVYTPSGPVVCKSNTTYSGLIIDLGKTTATAFSGNGVANVTIKNCKIINGAVGAMAVYFNNSSNITIDNNLITNIPRGIWLQSCVAGNLTVTNNQLQNILNSPSTLYHPIAVQNCKGGNIHIEYNHIEEIASASPYTHDQISIYQSYGLFKDSIVVAFNWIRGGQQKKNAAGNNGACAIGVGDSGGSYQSIHDNIMVNALGIAVDGSGTSLKIYNNKTYAKQIAPQPLSAPMVYFGNAGNNIMQNNTYNFTGPNGKLVSANFSMVRGTLNGQSTNIYNATITSAILPEKIITFQ